MAMHIAINRNFVSSKHSKQELLLVLIGWINIRSFEKVENFKATRESQIAKIQSYSNAYEAMIFVRNTRNMRNKQQKSE